MKKTLLTLTTAATVATLVPTNSADAAAQLRTDAPSYSNNTTNYTTNYATTSYTGYTQNTYQAPVTQTTNYSTPVYSNNTTVEAQADTSYEAPAVQKAPTSVAVNNDVASVALSIAAGKSYVFGANSASAVDCSSFAQQVLAAMGKSIPRTTYAQAAAGTQVSNPQPGDLVFFNNYSHVGVYIGGGQMVDALNPSAGVGQRAVSYISGHVDGYYRF
ncbi:C40 family peptidase [Macrococcoides caseolyticum]|uniref:C40 family peptidase n=1 Tax=Macrococcoides caseolyticum TaxID=69966 RepID=UPI001F208E23|nr:C40 family peptidase [Macrococcus caseolyticus]MCE4955976.1 C40 family peptidase [Macrococcus caseolyticus]